MFNLVTLHIARLQVRDGRELAGDHVGVHGRIDVRSGVVQRIRAQVRSGHGHPLLRVLHLLLLVPGSKRHSHSSTLYHATGHVMLLL